MKHSEEWWEVNNAIAEENGAFDCREAKHSPTGLCPCCGLELIIIYITAEVEVEIGVFFELDGVVQHCPDDDCGWSSLPLYDV